MTCELTPRNTLKSVFPQYSGAHAQVLRRIVGSLLFLVDRVCHSLYPVILYQNPSATLSNKLISCPFPRTVSLRRATL
jgi:hypothetical protein